MSTAAAEEEGDELLNLKLKKGEVEALAGTLMSVLRLNKWERRKMVAVLQRSSGLKLCDPKQLREGPPVSKKHNRPKIVTTLAPPRPTVSIECPPAPIVDKESVKSRIVMVGCGEIAALYLHCLLRKGDYRIIGVVDIDAQRAADFAQRVKDLQGGDTCAVAVTIDELFSRVKSSRPVVAINLTPVPYHFQTNLALLLHGCHVWSEKPLGGTFEEAKILVDHARERNVELGCAPSIFFGESQQCLGMHISKGRLLGDVQYVHANMFCGCFESETFRLHGGWKKHRRLGVGSLVDVGIYPISLLTLLFGPVVHVVAQQQDQSLDMYVVRLTFSAPDHHGVVATLASSMSLSAPKDRAFRIEFHGSHGSVSMKSIWNCDTTLGYCAEGGQPSEGEVLQLLPFAPPYIPDHSIPHPIKTNWAAGVQHLCESVDRCDGRTFTGQHAAHLCNVLDCINESAAQGGKRILTTSIFPACNNWFDPGHKQVASVSFSPEKNRHVSRLVFGTMSLGDATQPFDLLDAAWNMGCNTFDLAHVYGRKAESIFGNWLSKRSSAPTLRCGGVARSSVFIIGKGGHSHVKSPKLARLTEADITKDMNESLERAGIDCFDLYLLHRDDPKEFADVVGIVRLMSTLQDEGKIKSWGVSNWSVGRIVEACQMADTHGLARPVCSSPNYSLATPSHPVWPGTTTLDLKDVQVYKENNVMLITWAALAEGWLLGGTRRNNRECWENFPNLKRKCRAEAMAVSRGTSVAQVAIAFALSSASDAVVIGCRTIEHLQDLIKGSIWKLTEEEVQWLKA
jgi:aryl-alcohol dehydrogenase-like predicted oxidoreductase/predicted dehydrogenase